LNPPALLIDFGSTYTKITAVDLDSASIVGRAQAPSTVLTDVREGLHQALANLDERHAVFGHKPVNLGVIEGRLVLASSSAAGGLRMVVIGLVPGLTVEAANQAALGAGAKVVGSASFKLDEPSIRAMEKLKPDIILLTGGTDGGDSGTLLHNARVLAQSTLAAPVVVAGNRAVAAEVREILTTGSKEVRLAENVMPKPGSLAVESAREQIRQLFMERITQAKGLDRIKDIVPVVLPTPMAVIQGALLGAQGTDGNQGWGELIVVDVGGATTDVHSIGYGKPRGENAMVQGLPEPFAKRTVEGDLGIRYNAGTILAQVGLDSLQEELRAAFPQFTVSCEAFIRYVEEIGQETFRVPREAWHYAADAVLARAAVDLATERHVGKRERIFAREGEAWMHYGKDLSEIQTLIGTGGVFIYNPYTPYILLPRERENYRLQILRPKKPNLFVDCSYVLYAIGLLSRSYPSVAARLFQSHISPVTAGPLTD
jgi:uncharacterized protein (TIGR01319 family)